VSEHIGARIFYGAQIHDEDGPTLLTEEAFDNLGWVFDDFADDPLIFFETLLEELKMGHIEAVGSGYNYDTLLICAKNLGQEVSLDDGAARLEKLYEVPTEAEGELKRLLEMLDVNPSILGWYLTSEKS